MLFTMESFILFVPAILTPLSPRLSELFPAKISKPPALLHLNLRLYSSAVRNKFLPLSLTLHGLSAQLISVKISKLLDNRTYAVEIDNLIISTS